MYFKQFLDIIDFKLISHGKALLEIIKKYPQHSRIKVAVRKVAALFQSNNPTAKVCSLQFLKEAMELGCWSAVETIEKTVVPIFVQVLEYRSSVGGMQRGSSYFLKDFDKDVTE